VGKNTSKKSTPFDNPTVDTANRRASNQQADVSNPGPKHEAIVNGDDKDAAVGSTG
jgi:hypothetical protein